MITEVLVNGEPTDGRIPVTDSVVLRGDGCFEVLKAYNGKPFRLDDHVERLGRSAASLEIDLPPTTEIAGWITKIAEAVGDGAVRVVVTRGASVPGLDDAPRVVVFGHEWSIGSGPVRLHPVTAPWHAAGIDWDLAGAKILSYAPNVAATRRAQREGQDDALLISTDGLILEGPTFSVAWMIGDVLETPFLDLGILDSITRRVVLEEARRIGIEVVEGSWPLSRLASASEVMALSTVREVQSVSQVGEMTFDPGPVTARLSGIFDSLVG